MQDEDNVDHILLQCPYAREVWYNTWDTLQINTPPSTSTETTLEWWLRARKSFQGPDRRGFDTTVTAVLWALWKQRNARVFNRGEQVRTPTSLVRHIFGEIKLWKLARVGAEGLARFVRE